jgi:hypothetical protein
MSDVTDTFYPSKGFIGYGSQLLIGQDDGSPETFVAVAQVDTIEFGAMTAGIINKTHLRSPGRAHEKIATIRDVGAFKVSPAAEHETRLARTTRAATGSRPAASSPSIALVRSANMKIVLADGSPGTEVPFRWRHQRA